MAEPTPTPTPTAPVTAPAGDPHPVTFRLQYNPTLDRLATENAEDARWGEALRKEQEAAAAAQQQQQAEAGATAAKRPMQPSMFIEGLKAAAAQAYQGLQNMDEGLGQLPESPAQGARKVLIEGLMPLVLSPFAAPFKSLSQTVENFTPEVHSAELFDADAGFTVRHLMAGAPAIASMTPEQIAAMRKPMTVGEAIETLGPFLGPMVPKLAKGAKTAGSMAVEQVRAAGSERGSLGRPSAAMGVEAMRNAPIEAKTALDVARTHHAQLQKQIVQLEAAATERMTPEFRARAKQFFTDEQIDEMNARMAKLTPEARLGAQQLLAEMKGFEQQAAQAVTDAEAGLTAAREQAEAAKPGGAFTSLPTPPEGVDVRLNLQRITAEETVIETMANLNKFVGKEILKEHRKVKTHEQTLAEAAASRWTLEQMLTHDPEEIIVDAAKATQLRDTFAAASKFYDDLGRKALAGDQVAQSQLDSAFSVAMKLAALVEGQGRQAGRALEIQKVMAMGERAAKRASPAIILEVARKLGEGEVDPLLQYRRFARLSEPQQRSFLVNLYHGLRAGRDIGHAAWVQALLTNPKTHSANWAGTGLVVYGDIPETYVAGWINDIFRNDPKGVQRVEAAVKMRAMVEGYNIAHQMMVEAWKTGEEPFAAGKTKEHPVIAAETYGFAPESWPGKMIDTMGNTLRAKGMPTRGLIAEDAFWKGFAYHLEIEALAARKAIAMGLEGEAMKAQAKQFVNRPTVDMIQAAQDKAILLTLNKQLGPVGQAVMKVANMVPFMRVLFPFIQTPTNSGKYVIQRLPMTSLFSYQNWSDIMEGGAARDMAEARMALGGVAAVLIAARVMDGTITGSNYGMEKNLAALQRDPKTATKPPASLCPSWTDECFGINRMDPVGSFAIAIADYVELTSKVPPNQAVWEEWAAYGYALVSAIGQVAITKTWNTGLRNMLDATHDPNTAGAKMIANFSKSIIPAGMREVVREIDDNTIREVRGIGDAILSGIAPGYLYPQRNWITGEKVQYPPGWGPDIVSPITITKFHKNSPVFEEIEQNKAHMPKPPEYIWGRPEPQGPQTQQAPPTKGHRWTDEQYDRLITIQTKELKINGRTLFESLEDLVKSEDYLRFPSAAELRKAGYRPEDGTRKTLLDDRYAAFRQAAVNKAIDEFKLGDELKEKATQAIRPKLPATDVRSPAYRGGGTPTLRLDLAPTLMR